MSCLGWFFILAFSLIQGIAPLVHAHPKLQGHGFHLHAATDSTTTFQITQAKQSESLPLSCWVEQAALPAKGWQPLCLAAVLHHPLKPLFHPHALFSSFFLFARAPPLA
jgi:hypothetical protein